MVTELLIQLFTDKNEAIVGDRMYCEGSRLVSGESNKSNSTVKAVEIDPDLNRSHATSLHQKEFFLKILVEK